MSEPFTQQREQPAEWPTLLATATVVTEQDDALLTAQVVGLAETVAGLNRDPLDANRYYAIGLLLCEYAAELETVARDSGQRGALVQAGAGLLEADHLAREAKTPYPTSEIPFNVTKASAAFQPTFERAVERLPAAVRLLGNYLTIEDNPNRGKLEMVRVRQFAYDELLEGDEPFIRSVGNDLVAGFSKINPILGALYAQDASRASKERYNLHALPNTSDLARLRHESMLRFLRGMTPFLLDSFIAIDVGQRLELAPEGVGRFDATAERQRQQRIFETDNVDDPPPKDPYDTRSEIHVCPAATIPQLLRTKFGLLCEMVAVAATELATKSLSA